MISVNLRPDPFGFWYLIRADQRARFRFSFIAICTGGHHKYGELSGECASEGSWQYKELGQPVIHAAIEKLDVVQLESDPATKHIRTPRDEFLDLENIVHTDITPRDVGAALGAGTLYMLQNLKPGIGFIPMNEKSGESSMRFDDEDDPYYPYYPYGSS